jgi:ThiF family
MRTWIDLYRDRLEFEVAELERLGLVVDDDQLSDARRLVARGRLSTQTHGDIDVTIVYPDSFPHLRPEVMAPGLRLGRHQNPYQGNLCLLDRSTREWEVTDTGAWLLTERVPLLLGLLERGGAALREGEAPQGEPWSTYLRFEPGTAVFVPVGALAVGAEQTGGQLELAFSPGEPPSGRLRALLRRVTVRGPRAERTVAEADEDLRTGFSGTVLHGRWVRLPGAPEDPTPLSLLSAVVAADPSLKQPRWRHAGDSSIDVVGCLISEEVTHGHEEQGWVFLVRIRRTTGPHRRQEAVYITRGERLSERDLAARIPTLTPLRERSVLLVGAGALGAPVVLELARCGVGRISIIDGETLEAGNTVRWPLGLSAVGWPKVNALAGWIQSEYPYTKVSVIPAHVGHAPNTGELEVAREQSELDVLAELLEGTDLVIDATAELGVQHFLSAVAGDVPQLYVWATEGAGGGFVARVTHDTGCWLCLQLHIRDGALPVPSRIEEDTVQPRGCATPTFTGTSYDLAAVANQAVRVAVAQLLGRSPRDQDITICSLWDGVAWLAAPRWECTRLERHPECALCPAAIAA